MLAQVVKSKIWIVLLLFSHFLDIFIPPAKLPPSDEQKFNERIGTNSLLSFVWELSTIKQFMIAIVATGMISGTIIRRQGSETKHSASTISSGLWEASAIIMSLSGWALRSWAKSTLSTFFTYRISQPTSLITTGPYSLLVHPGYLGGILHKLGILVLLVVMRSGHIMIASFVVLCSMHVFNLLYRIKDEEEMLHAHFGDDQWTRHVTERWHLIPFWW